MFNQQFVGTATQLIVKSLKRPQVWTFERSMTRVKAFGCVKCQDVAVTNTAGTVLSMMDSKLHYQDLGSGCTGWGGGAKGGGGSAKTLSFAGCF